MALICDDMENANKINLKKLLTWRQYADMADDMADNELLGNEVAFS